MLDATVGGSTSNSYVTRERGKELMAQRLYTEAFDALDPADQDKAFMMATRLIDTHLCFMAPPATPTQALRFPASGLELYGQPVPTDIIPYAIEDATVEQARLLATTDTSTPSDQAVQGLKKVKVSTIELEFFAAMEMKAVPAGVSERIPRSWQCPTAADLEAAAALKSRRAEFQMI